MSIKVGTKTSPYVKLMLQKYSWMRDHEPTYFELENDRKLKKENPEGYEIAIRERSQFMEHFRRMIEFIKK